jgi:folylpolyglutamate synthase/dihydropteroate synthase
MILIFGASSDKDVPGMLAEFMPYVGRVLMTQAVHPRAWEPEDLAERAREARPEVPVEVVSPVARALERAVQLSAPEDVIVACGSLFVVAEVRTAWMEREEMVDR